MARARTSALLSGLSGTIGDIVIKQYRYGTVISKRPDMTGVKPTNAQKKKRSVFAEAVEYAKAIVADPLQKEKFQRKIGRKKTVYHEAIREYLKRNRKE